MILFNLMLLLNLKMQTNHSIDGDDPSSRSKFTVLRPIMRNTGIER